MSIFMPIIIALKSGFINPQQFVAYSPDKKRSMHITRITWLMGCEEKETEFDLGWHAVIYKDFGVLLVADKVTKATLTLTNGYINTTTLEIYSNLYQNESLQSIGVVPTLELLKEIPESLRHDEVCIAYSNKQKFSFRRQTRRYHYNPSVPHDHRRHFGPTYSTKHVQPILFIPPDTIVEIENGSQVGTCKENGFKLYPRNSFKPIELPEQCLEFAHTPIWVPLTEAVRARAILDSDFVDYIPDKSSVSFSKEETNTRTVQSAETEYDMGGWHPIVIKKGENYQSYLVSTHCSKFELEIWPQTDEYHQSLITSRIGKNQFDVGIELLNRYAKIYSNKKLNTQGIPFNEELFDALGENLIEKGDSYFLANTFTHNFHFLDGLGEITEEYELRMGLMWIAHGLSGYKQCKDPINKTSIRIAIPCSSNIMVQINNPEYDGSTEKKAFKIKLA